MISQNILLLFALEKSKIYSAGILNYHIQFSSHLLSQSLRGILNWFEKESFQNSRQFLYKSNREIKYLLDNKFLSGKDSRYFLHL